MNPEKITGNSEPNQNEQNEDLLSKSELAVLLEDAYRSATELDPRLRDMKIVTIDDPNEKAHGFAVASDVSASGKHEVHIRLNNIDDVLNYYAQAMHDYPVSIEIMSRRMKVNPNQLTPQLLYVQSVLHEMGHVTEHMDFENSMDDLRQRNKQERTALPLGYVSLTRLMDPNSELRQRVDQHWDELSQKHGVSDIMGLARLQGETYRGLTSETVADNFASDVFDINPQLKDQLLQPNVDTYRDFAMAA